MPDEFLLFPPIQPPAGDTACENDMLCGIKRFTPLPYNCSCPLGHWPKYRIDPVHPGQLKNADNEQDEKMNRWPEEQDRIDPEMKYDRIEPGGFANCGNVSIED